MISYPWLEKLHTNLSKLPNLLIVEGPAGYGKFETVYERTIKIFCEEKTGCDSCYQCSLVKSGNHPDLLVIDQENDLIGVDEGRKLIEFMSLTSSSSPSKVALINNANLMNKPAQNSILKITEEINLKNHIIFISNRPKSLLSTIYSRCQQINISPLSYTQINEWLRSLGYDETIFNFPSYFSPKDIINAINNGERDTYKNFLNTMDSNQSFADQLGFFKELKMPYLKKIDYLIDYVILLIGRNTQFYSSNSTTNRYDSIKLQNLSQFASHLINYKGRLLSIKSLNEQIGIGYFLSKLHHIKEN